MTALADVLVLSCSMTEHSRSRAAAQWMRTHLEEGGWTVEWVDARELPREWGAEEATKFGERFCRSRAAVIAFPVYDWACSARTKELVVLGLEGEPAEFRPTALIAGGGGLRSFLAYGELATALTAESNAIMVGRAIHAQGDEVEPESGSISGDLAGSICAHADALVALLRSDEVVSSVAAKAD